MKKGLASFYRVICRTAGNIDFFMKTIILVRFLIYQSILWLWI